MGKINAANIMDAAFNIYRAKFLKQFIVTIIINLIFVTVAVLALWVSFYKIVPNASGLTDGLYAVAVTTATVVLLVLFFQFLVTGANIVIAHNEKIGFIKSLPYLITVFFAQIIIYLPFLALFGFIGYATKLNGVVIFALAAIAGMVFLFINTLLMLSVPIAIIEKKPFIKPIKESFLIVSSKENLFRLLGINGLWTLISWSVFVISAAVSSFVFPVPNVIKSLPFFSQYATLLYNIWLAYLITIIISPLNKNILYAAYKPPYPDPHSGFGSKLLAFVVDLYLLLVIFAAAFYAIFSFMSINSQNAVFTADLPPVVWLAVALMLAMSISVYRFIFKYLLNRKTPGEKLIIRSER